MSHNEFPLRRSMRGNMPALAAREDEAYLDFIANSRQFFIYGQWGNLVKAGDAALAETEEKTGQKPTNIEAIKSVLVDVPELAAFLRFKRTIQESGWRRVMDSFEPHLDHIETAFDVSDSQGPGSVTWDPNFAYPEYAIVDIHIQPSGYTGHPLAGLIYDHGTNVFFGSNTDNFDALHQQVAASTSLPQDGQATRILDMGCSIGQLTCALKQRFSEAEIWGIDISAPMVRYAHWRALQQDLDVHFAQMPTEKMDFPDGHFDLITAHILFHELPVEIIRATVKEAFRVLRPGGTFVIWDFSTVSDTDESFTSFMGKMDAVDNGEPYAIGFVTCGVENILEQTGFRLRSQNPQDQRQQGRIADKPQ